jgi:sigma-B regulation protein RsbU (phosphoserine phosphatase)
MHVQDLRQNRRIARLTQLTRELQHSRNADQTMRILRQGLVEMEGFVPSLFVSTRGLGPAQYRVVRANLTEGSEGDLLRPSHDDQDRIRSGGVVGSITSGNDPKIVLDVDWSSDPDFSVTLHAYRSAMAVPIAGDHLPMNWAILLKQTPEQFAVTDLEHAVARVALMAALLENQLLADELARAHERIDRDARQVGNLQRALLPGSPPRIAGLEIAASYEPCGRAGGDLYDFFPLNQAADDRAAGGAVPPRWCVLIGDASGHGLAPAVVMAIVQAVLHAHPMGIDGPAALLAHANRQLCAKRLDGFFTAFLGVYEPSSRRLTYANAGHPAPLLKRAADASLDALDAVASYPLGIDDAESFTEAAVPLERGDMVLLYTDGITESREKQGDLFGLERLRELVRDARVGTAGLIDRVRAAVYGHRHGNAAPDDQTLVAARVL